MENFVTCVDDSETIPYINVLCNLECENCTVIISFDSVVNMTCIDSTEDWTRGVALLRCNYSGDTNVTLQIEDFPGLKLNIGSDLPIVSSTMANFLPIYRFQLGCHGSYKIPFDPGSENAKCRWENETEHVKGATLTEDCDLTLMVNGDSEPGYEIVSIIIITDGTVFKSQFFTFKYINNIYCGYKPEFDHQDSCVAVKQGDILTLTVQADSHYSYDVEYYELVRPSPMQNQVSVTNVTKDEGIEVEVIMPNEEYLSEATCFNALTQFSISSYSRCVQFMAISNGSEFTIPNNGNFDHADLIVAMVFDYNVRLGENGYYLRIYHGENYLRSFWTYYSRISLQNQRLLMIDLTGYNDFILDEEYRVEIEEGFLMYDFGCHAKLPPLSFSFSPKNLQKPLLMFSYNPSTKTSNTTMTISWTSEIVNRTDECILETLDTSTTEYVTCNMSYWESDEGLNEGSYVFIVNSNDTEGNSATYNLEFTIDRTKPEAYFITLPSKVSNLAYSNRIFSIRCYTERCAANFIFRNTNTGAISQETTFDSFSWSFSTEIPENSLEHLQTYNLEVRLFDLAGNWIELGYEWTVDAVKPVIGLSNDTLVDCETVDDLIEPTATDDHNITMSYSDSYGSCILTRTWTWIINFMVLLPVLSNNSCNCRSTFDSM